MGTPKNLAKNLPVATSTKRAGKKGNSTPKAKKPRSTGRYVDLKIRLPIGEYNRGLPYFEDQKYLVRFMLDAYREKLNRAEANDKAGRLRILAGNMALLEPILKEMYAQGKLNFLLTQQESANG
jgi:hypothetical protein